MRRPKEEIRFARTCYDHLAGELGVRLTDILERNGSLVVENEQLYRLTPEGEIFLQQWKIDAPALRGLKRSFARRCLDWTERRDHLAGALGAAIYQRFLEFDWVRHDAKSRAVHLTAEGRRRLEPLLNSSMDRNSHDSGMPDIHPSRKQRG